MGNLMTPAELEKARNLLVSRDSGITATAGEMKYRTLAKRLFDTLDDQAMELARHHRDFQVWEDMTNKGAQQIAKAKAWDHLYEDYKRLLESSSGLSINPLVAGVVAEMDKASELSEPC